MLSYLKVMKIKCSSCMPSYITVQWRSRYCDFILYKQTQTHCKETCFLSPVRVYYYQLVKPSVLMTRDYQGQLQGVPGLRSPLPQSAWEGRLAKFARGEFLDWMQTLLTYTPRAEKLKKKPFFLNLFRYALINYEAHTERAFVWR